MDRKKTAIVTGCTSGMGLGIEQALAGAGHNIVINGFGNADDIKALRANLPTRAGVEVKYGGADTSQPRQIAQRVRDVILASQPNKRFVEVSHLGELALFLDSDAAASNTGIAMPIVGGWTAH